MNYPPNTTIWQPGDLVIHDADGKCPEMLMVVTETWKDNGAILCETRYLDPGAMTPKPKGAYVNRIEALHDPARFGIIVPSTDPDQRRAALLRAIATIDGDATPLVALLRLIDRSGSGRSPCARPATATPEPA
jgi:hypothetical protein